MGVVRSATRASAFMSAPRCICRHDADTSEGCPVHDHRPQTNPDEYAVMWCHDERVYTVAYHLTFDGPDDPWMCDGCGSPILCDGCGAELTPDHDEGHG